MRPGTLKAPLFADMPLIGRVERGLIDVVVYAAPDPFLNCSAAQSSSDTSVLWPVVALVPVLGLLDGRFSSPLIGLEHYWVMTFGFAMGDDGLAVALDAAGTWFWAGVSKLNSHFPTVVGVMVVTVLPRVYMVTQAHVSSVPRGPEALHACSCILSLWNWA